jgi:integrase
MQSRIKFRIMSDSVKKDGGRALKVEVEGRNLRVEVFPWRGPFFYLRVEHKGKGIMRSLGTDLPKVAAEKAARLWIEIREGRLEDKGPVVKVATVGEVVERFRFAGIVKDRVARDACSALVRFAGEGRAVGFDARSVRVDELGVEQWRALLERYRARALAGPDKWGVKRVNISANSVVRMVRMLFSPKARRSGIYEGLVLPDVILPGVELLPEPGVRYDAGVWRDLKGMGRALAELRLVDPGVWLAVKFSAQAGLRAGEIAAMRWGWLRRRGSGGVVEVREGADWSPKSRDRVVALSEVDWHLINEFRGADDAFVLPGDSVTARGKVLRRARAWVSGWMVPGARTKKRLHELRKHLGSVVLERDGLDRAAQVLGHAPGSRVTADHYASYLTIPKPVEVL